MSFVDMYRNNVMRKRDELTRLSDAKARETAKIPAQRSKILSAKNAMSHTKSISTIKSKMGEIERAEQELARIEKSKADIDRKIATKEKECAAEEKKYEHEKNKNEQKRIQEEKKRLHESKRAMQSIDNTLQQHSIVQQRLSVEIDNLKNVPEKITVLFFAANPIDTERLRLDKEVRSIQDMICKSEHRDSISFESRWAVRTLDILQAINEVNPDVIHFSGHGSETGELILENADGNTKLITKEAIAQTIMASTDKIRLMLFNACFSSEQAASVVKHADAAIGMKESISDEGACIFAAQFYSSLGFGLSVRKSFEQAKAALMLENISEQHIPSLHWKDGVNVDNLIIVNPTKCVEGG